MFWESAKFWLSAILALSVPMVLYLGLQNRRGGEGDKAKGIGWQFIRFSVLTITIPVVGVLALNDSLSAEASALIGGAVGYAFGKSDA